MESTFHLGILRERPDVNVVLHFQSEYATAISCMKNKPTNFNVTAEIPCHVGSEIPVIPYYRPGSPELAKAVVEAMLEHNSVLLTNHGQVVCYLLRNGLPYYCSVRRRLFSIDTSRNRRFGNLCIRKENKIVSVHTIP